MPPSANFTVITQPPTPPRPLVVMMGLDIAKIAPADSPAALASFDADVRASASISANAQVCCVVADILCALKDSEYLASLPRLVWTAVNSPMVGFIWVSGTVREKNHSTCESSVVPVLEVLE